MIARLQQPVAERAQLVGHRAQAREARGQQLADRPLLGVLEHVLDHLDRRDGERQVVALAVAARLEQRLVGELRRVERRDVAQVRLKGDEVGSDVGDVGGMWEGCGRDAGGMWGVTQARLQRDEGVLDLAPRLDVGALLDERPTEVAAEGGEEGLQQRRLRRVVGRDGGAERVDRLR